MCSRLKSPQPAGKKSETTEKKGEEGESQKRFYQDVQPPIVEENLPLMRKTIITNEEKEGRKRRWGAKTMTMDNTEGLRDIAFFNMRDRPLPSEPFADLPDRIDEGDELLGLTFGSASVPLGQTTAAIGKSGSFYS